MPQLPNLTNKQWAGFICICLAGIGWLITLLTPVLPVPNKRVLFIISLSFAELMFIIGIVLLGRAYYHQIKDAFIKRLKKP